MPFLFRLFLSYAVTVLAVCLTLMSNLEGPDPWESGSTPIRTISVVLPCANESFVDRTVRSIQEATPKEELLEIIIVDDASWPPVTSLVIELENNLILEMLSTVLDYRAALPNIAV